MKTLRECGNCKAENPYIHRKTISTWKIANKKGAVSKSTYVIECSGCGIATKEFNSEIEAINSWNMRGI